MQFSSHQTVESESTNIILIENKISMIIEYHKKLCSLNSLFKNELSMILFNVFKEILIVQKCLGHTLVLNSDWRVWTLDGNQYLHRSSIFIGPPYILGHAMFMVESNSS